MKRKGLAVLGLVAGLSVLSSMSAFAGECKTIQINQLLSLIPDVYKRQA